jgi:hypothetical protein
MAKLVLQMPVSKSDVETLARIERVAKPPPALDSDPSTRAILFLRAAAGRASLCLPAFYVFLGAEASTDEQKKNWSHAQFVKRYALRFSAIGTIALCARAIFDHHAVASSGELYAKNVTTLSAKDVEKVSAYWANGDVRKEEDARLGLAFVRKTLTRCAININDAKKSGCILTRRVGLLKAYANREAGHISLNTYEFDHLDVVHVVAATALLGAVIHHFDRREDTGAQYLNGIDESAYAAGIEIFPELARMPRLFDGFDVENALRNLYRGRIVDGVDYLSTWLLSALGWDGWPKE